MLRITAIILFVLIGLTTYGQSDTTAPKLWQPYRITPRTGVQHVDLSGTGWTLSHTDKPVATIGELTGKQKDAFQTTVPNSMHWAYYKAGKLPPYHLERPYLTTVSAWNAPTQSIPIAPKP